MEQNAESELIAAGDWGVQEPVRGISERAKAVRDTVRRYTTSQQESTNIWFNPGLKDHEATANLDNQQPATLYYLAQVKDLPEVKQVYVEEREHERKHWAVLSERDYEVMDKIYLIEEDTLDRFPAADIDFRVTILTDDGPSVSTNATKIFDSK